MLGAIPEDRAMLAVTVEQVAAHLGGAWVQEPENTDSLIERFLIGGNILDSGETYYGRYSNQAVIVRTERPDIQLASLMEDTTCLVLTGRGDPTEYIKAEAMQRSVPLIRVEQDTIPTAESLAGLLDKAAVHSTREGPQVCGTGAGALGCGGAGRVGLGRLAAADPGSWCQYHRPRSLLDPLPVGIFNTPPTH